MRIGYLPCRGCGSETNCADLVSGYCPSCARAHAAALASLQREYEGTLAAGDPAAAKGVGEIISSYENSEGLRLKDATHDL